MWVHQICLSLAETSQQRDFVGQGLSSTRGTYRSSLIGHITGHIGRAATFPIYMNNDIDANTARVGPNTIAVSLCGRADGK